MSIPTSIAIVIAIHPNPMIDDLSFRIDHRSPDAKYTMHVNITMFDAITITLSASIIC
jgi:hypothetical protein